MRQTEQEEASPVINITSYDTHVNKSFVYPFQFGHMGQKAINYGVRRRSKDQHFSDELM